jgi:hypothetical protein
MVMENVRRVAWTCGVFGVARAVVHRSGGFVVLGWDVPWNLPVLGTAIAWGWVAMLGRDVIICRQLPAFRTRNGESD